MARNVVLGIAWLVSGLTILASATGSLNLPLCDPEVLAALQSGVETDFNRLRVVGFELHCRTANDELLLHAALQREDALAEAISKEIVLSYTQSSVLLDTTDADGLTPLQVAASKGFPDVVSALLDKGADFQVMDESQRRIMHLGAHSEAVVTVLLADDASQSWSEASLSEKDATGNLPLHLALQASSYGSASFQLDVVEASADGRNVAKTLASTVDGNGDYPIHWCGNLAMYERLRRYGVSLIAFNGNGAVPLHTLSGLSGAAQEGVLAEAALVISNDVNRVDDIGRTPLHYAAASGSLDNVQWLLDRGVAADVIDFNGHTPVMAAMLAGHLFLAPLLADSAGESVLSGAIALERLDILQSLITELGTPIDEPHPVTQRTALFSAATAGLPDMIDYLVAEGAAIERQDAEGVSVLAAAVAAQQAASVQKLLELGASPTQPLAAGERALHFAARGGDASIVNMLLNGSIGVNTADYLGITPLHVATSAEAAHALLLAGAFSTASEEGWLPLHTAVVEGRESAARVMLAWRTSDGNVRGKGGNAPLHLAARNGDSSMVTMLLQWCADVTTTNDAGESPMLVATGSTRSILEHPEYVEALCTCDCGPFQRHPAYLTNWNGSCDVVLECANGGSSFQEARCSLTSEPPDLPAILQGDSGSWDPEEFATETILSCGVLSSRASLQQATCLKKLVVALLVAALLPAVQTAAC